MLMPPVSHARPARVRGSAVSALCAGYGSAPPSQIALTTLEG